MRIFDKLSSLESQFDVFIFDAYGVFYNGQSFYPNACEYMQELVAKRKTVVVLSNSSQSAAKAMQKYATKGLIAGKNYQLFVTSGQVCHEDAREKSLPVAGNKYYILGHGADAMTDQINYQEVSRMEDADFVFISVPQLNPSEQKRAQKFEQNILPVKADEQGRIVLWDSTIIDPFLTGIRRCVELGLPAVNANPDFYASEKHLGADQPAYVVRNGLIAEYYRQAGGKVYEYGKPWKNVYDYTFRCLQKMEISSPKQKIAMIGDTIRTDVKGAVNAGICPILCVETGVTAEEISKGAELSDMLDREKINSEQIYLIRSVA